ncbi:hypothetical protein [Treponema porcinum]|uniref:hypothetical protein n=1 Tax=Treponema porcinum TaxID=261392 RepID=UPI003F049C7A
MNRFDKLRHEINEHENTYRNEVQSLVDESKRTAYVANHVSEIISDIDKKFERATKLTKTDIAFLFLAVGLQCCRQYLLTDFKERMGDQEAADNTPLKDKVDPHDLKARKESGYEQRHHKLYNPTLTEIINHPVPFDTTKGGKIFGDANPFPNSGKLGHRASAIGHDPVLGWIFGTANIATSTITGWNMNSFHVFSKTGAGGGDFLKYRAETSKVLSYTYDKLLNQGDEGKKIVAFSLVKEGVHLLSDLNTKNSLPFPIISTVDPELASALADYGIDMSNIVNVGKQIAVSSAINLIVVMLHRLLYNEQRDGDIKLYEVRTRKIIDYSNIIASTSNILVVAIGAGIGAGTNKPDLIKKSLQKIDIGGFIVTLHRLINDGSFIKDIKEEFLANRWYDIVINA